MPPSNVIEMITERILVEIWSSFSRNKVVYNIYINDYIKYKFEYFSRKIKRF